MFVRLLSGIWACGRSKRERGWLGMCGRKEIVVIDEESEPVGDVIDIKF